MISSRRFKATATDGRTLEGYASIYGAPSGTIREIGRTFTETIQRGAFDASLAAGGDVKLYFQHDPSMPLARTQSGTARSTSSAIGIVDGSGASMAHSSSIASLPHRPQLDVVFPSRGRGAGARPPVSTETTLNSLLTAELLAQ